MDRKPSKEDKEIQYARFKRKWVEFLRSEETIKQIEDFKKRHPKQCFYTLVPESKWLFEDNLLLPIEDLDQLKY
jgi:hypothetical protein